MPIQGFEEYTHNLTDAELKEVPNFVKHFSKKVGEKNSVTSREIISAYGGNGKIKMTGPRIRKIINYIRVNKLIKNLIGSSKGYYIEEDPNKILEYKESLMQRAREIMRVANTYEPTTQGEIFPE